MRPLVRTPRGPVDCASGFVEALPERVPSIADLAQPVMGLAGVTGLPGPGAMGLGAGRSGVPGLSGRAGRADPPAPGGAATPPATSAAMPARATKAIHARGVEHTTSRRWRIEAKSPLSRGIHTQSRYEGGSGSPARTGAPDGAGAGRAAMPMTAHEMRSMWVPPDSPACIDGLRAAFMRTGTSPMRKPSR